MNFNILKARSLNTLLGLLIVAQIIVLLCIVVLLINSLVHDVLSITTIISYVAMVLICLPLSVFLYLSRADRDMKQVFLALSISLAFLIVSGIFWEIVPAVFNTTVSVPIAKLTMVLSYVPIVLLLPFFRRGSVIIAPHIRATILFISAIASIVVFFFVSMNLIKNGGNSFDAFIYTFSTIADILILALCSLSALYHMQNEYRYVFLALMAYFLLGLIGDSLNLLQTIGLYETQAYAQFSYDLIYILTACALIAYSLGKLKITTVEEVNKKLHDTRRLMDDLIMESPEAIGIFDAGGDVIMANPAFRQLAGKSQSPGRPTINLFRDASRLFGTSPEIACIRDGGTVQAEVARAPEQAERQGRYYHLKASPAHDSEGKITGYIVIMVDITDRKRYEEELVRAKNQAELYLDLMGHDINNMNQIGIGFLEMALERIRLDNEGQMMIRKPLEAMQNSSHLIDNLKKIRRVDTESFCLEPVDLGKTLGEVVQQYKDLPGRDALIEYVPVNECYVLANPLLKDVFSNLINNAIKHSGGPVKIWVSVSAVGSDRPGHYRVTVEDNGPGIPHNARQVLLEPAHSYKNRAGGRGLGLYLVRVLVDSFKGMISVEDRAPGDTRPGTRITITLPAVDSMPGAPAAP